MTKSRRLAAFLGFLLASVAVASAAGIASAALTHLPNGGFENFDPANPALAAGWSAYVSGYVIDTNERHTGARGLRCESTSASGMYGAATSVTLDQSEPGPIVVSGWSKSLDVAGSPDSNYSIYVDIQYMDGTPLYGQTVAFETGTHDWQRRQVVIVPAKPIRSMAVSALFRTHLGTVWFDDFDARELSPDALFDDQNLHAPVLSPANPGGWYVRDVAAGSPLIPMRVGLNKLGIVMEDQTRASRDRVLVADFRNVLNQDRAVTIYYIERFDVPNPVWWNDIRSSIPAGSPREYANFQSVNVGATGHISSYPFGCATGGGTGRALGVPAWLGPRVYRIALDTRAHMLYVAFDLALTPAGDKARHDRAQVAITRYDVDPAWGFRDAAATYYALFPDSFVRRAGLGGIWMPFDRPEDVQGMADFHIGFHEGDNSVAADRAVGILSFRYIEPMTYWMAMPPSMPRDYAHAFALLQHNAAGSGSESEMARAVLNSGTCDRLGRLNVMFSDTPWCDGATWILDPNPALQHGRQMWTKSRLNADGEPVPGRANEPDGEYLDSLEGWAGTLNYRPSSLEAAGEPGTFTPFDTRPTVPTWFSVYDDAARISRDLHARGKLLMANDAGNEFSVFVPLLDVLGTEMNSFDATGAWYPEADAAMNMRRTLAYHKPYLELLDTNFNKATHAGIQLYMERCMFYGFFPSMFSADASTHTYWTNPALYDRDRELFENYLPVIQRLYAAGWEPVTLARSDNPNVWVERYGNSDFTVMNTTDSMQATTIDTRNLDAPTGSLSLSLIVKDLVTGKPIAATVKPGEISLRLNLKPHETRVFEIFWGGP